MQPTDDGTLLRRYAESQSDEAFAALVARHVNLVYSVALRQVGNPHHAEEIAQAVFIILAKKAGRLRHEKALSSWLFRTTRLTSNNFVRSEMRRHRREQEAHMQSVLDESGSDVWPRIAPLLDTAVEGLSEKDRRAVVLRFYEGRNLREVGTALGASEGAAEKRVGRALDKLRKFFVRRGVTLSVSVLTAAISANSVQAAPIGLVITAATAAKGSAVATSTLTLIKGALKIMAWTKVKTAVVAGAALILAAGTTTVIVKNSGPHHPPAKWEWTPAEKDAFRRESVARINQGRQWALASLMFAEDNQKKLPDNFEQMKTYAPGLLSANWEIVSGGDLTGMAEPAQTILLREKELRQAPAGKFAKVYVFVDGHVEVISSPDYDFAALETQRGFLTRPAKN